MIRYMALLVPAMLMQSTAAGAQDIPVRAGDMVRVTVDGEKHVVEVRYIRPGSFAGLASGGRRPVEYSFSEIERLERRQRRTPGTREKGQDR